MLKNSLDNLNERVLSVLNQGNRLYLERSVHQLIGDFKGRKKPSKGHAEKLLGGLEVAFLAIQTDLFSLRGLMVEIDALELPPEMEILVGQVRGIIASEEALIERIQILMSLLSSTDTQDGQDGQVAFMIRELEGILGVKV
ncbi:MAG: hypothetical protein FWF59_03165 [Turicibacter sp.]|nr:hypothetical protein [Turicibacter sp.]